MTPDADPVLTRETSFHPRTSELTKSFVEYRGYWLPHCFNNEGGIAEYWACREKAVVMDLSPLRKWEILGPEPGALKDFYTQLFDWTIGQSLTEGFEYHMIQWSPGDRGIAGAVGSSPDGKAYVNVYADVEDLQPGIAQRLSEHQSCLIGDRLVEARGIAGIDQQVVEAGPEPGGDARLVVISCPIRRRGLRHAQSPRSAARATASKSTWAVRSCSPGRS